MTSSCKNAAQQNTEHKKSQDKAALNQTSPHKTLPENRNASDGNAAEKAVSKGHCLYSKSKLPAADYVINPYIGCTHNCLYCYASFMGRFTGHKEKWGTYIEPKRFSSMKLPRKQEGTTILVGSVTDAYNPAEKKYRLMLGILEALRNSKAHVEILTKSKLILRDMELLRQIPDLSVGVSLAFSSQQDAGNLEPGAASVQERLDTLKSLHQNGISTYLFVAPYFPEITNLRQLVASTEGFVDSVCVENLNLRGSYKATVIEYIANHHPRLLPLYQEIYVMGMGKAYWNRLEQEMAELREHMKVPLISYLYHEEIKK